MGLRELLRPPSHRGPLIAAGGVALAVGVGLVEFRYWDELASGWHAVMLLATGGLLYWLGVQAPNEGGVPPAYQSVLLATALPLLLAGLLRTGHALGANFEETPVATLVWTSAVTAGLALWPAFERNSAICLLMAALLGALLFIAAFAWAFEAFGFAAYRWILLVYALLLVLAGLALREPAPRHGEVLMDAAGLSIAAIAAPIFVGPVYEETLPAFWEIVLLGAGLGLVAFGAVDRSPGPAYLGVLNLILFIGTAGRGDSLIVWPLLLLGGGIAMLAAGLRPRRPLPPEPNPYRAGEAPLAARADDEADIVVRVRDDG